MPKYFNFAIVVSFFGLWIASVFSNETQILIGFALIFSIGILHGANDLLLLEKVNIKKGAFSRVGILSCYVLMVLMVTLLFYFVPKIALALFLIISAYHFGEQQWQHLEDFFYLGVRLVFEFCYGSVVLLLLFSFHLLEVQKIIFAISSSLVSTNFILFLLAFFGLFLTVFGIYFCMKTKKIRSQLAMELFHLLVFTIIFKSSSLIWGFAIYFVFWHSLPSIINQTKFLYGALNKTNFILYLKSALLYWIISLLAIASIYYLFSNEKIFNALFFSFLAAITFPHVLVIVKVFGKESKST